MAITTISNQLALIRDRSIQIVKNNPKIVLAGAVATAAAAVFANAFYPVYPEFCETHCSTFTDYTGMLDFSCETSCMTAITPSYLSRFVQTAEVIGAALQVAAVTLIGKAGWDVYREQESMDRELKDWCNEVPEDSPEYTGRLIAVGLIKNVYIHRHETLDLSGLSLTTVPQCIGNLSSLTELNLVRNRLRILPNSIWKLVNLKELFLAKNHLTTLPDDIGELVNLVILFLGQNKIKILPDSVGKLAKLKLLELNENRLGTLPGSIGELANLRSLYVSKNKLAILPDDIGKLAKLDLLELSENRLTALPDSIGKLVKLIWLELSENRLARVPDSIGDLSALLRLDLSKNQLAALPHSIGKCAAMAMLNLEDNHLRSIPLTVIKLRMTCKVNAKSNPLLPSAESRLELAIEAQRRAPNQAQPNITLGPHLELSYSSNRGGD